MPGEIKSKKIIVICHNYEPEYTLRKPDPENRFFTYGFGGNIGKNIKHYNPDYDVEVWRLDSKVNKYYEGIVNNVKFRVYKSIYIKKFIDISYRFYRDLKKEVKLNDPILLILHTHYWLAYQILFSFRSSKIITTHHGDWSPFFRLKFAHGAKFLKAKFDVIAEKHLFKYIDYIFTSDMNQIQYFKMANPDFKYVMWSSGVNFDFMKPASKDEARKKLGWPADKKYILYIGKLYRYKQADELIKMWLEIKKERPEIELVIIGNNPDDPWEEYSEMARKSGAMMLGRILNSELFLYYSAADVYVLFALRDDYFGGTGIATLEALACNTPVVSYAMRNYIGDDTGDIAEIPDTIEKYKDCVIKVIDNPGLYKNMRESVFKHYSYESVYTRIRSIFEELFASRKQ
jgi:glycosyltransferase involved in cell wall biosynthesis